MAWVALIPLLPALAFATLLPMSRELRNRSRVVAVAAIALALVLSLAAFVRVYASGSAERIWEGSFSLGVLGGTPLEIGLALDAVTAVMLIVITVVGLCVQVYSLGYMHREERIGWYYAVLSLFTAAMLLLVLAKDFLLLYVSWEIMGLCSYLLIGFWHEMEGPRKASQKAFLTTRVGDIGFAIGLFIIWRTAGTFDIEQALAGAGAWAPGIATTAALCLLFGAMGKSAQVPLHVWLPDAMAGPTPASALIHAATMVAAGVYLVARAMPVFEASGVALGFTLAIGTITALVGGLLAAVQHDVKKVLAYSTISQLGFMFVALGVGAVNVAMFHLVTHAFFKSLLFLGAGSIIHAAHTQDMREMGGLARHLPWTSASFGIGALALAGIFPLSGFWSKDEILAAVYHDHHYVVFVLALAAAFITAFYVARLWFRVFTGPVQTEGLHESHGSMVAPMALLAAITLVVGVSAPWFSEFLGYKGHWPELPIAVGSSVVALAGLAAGWWFYGRRSVVVNTRPLKLRLGYVYDMLAQKLYFDLTYDFFFVRGFIVSADRLAVFDGRWVDGAVNGAGRAWAVLSAVSWKFDASVIDGAVNGLAVAARSTGEKLRRIQTGRIQTYQRLVFGALVIVMVYLTVKGV